MTVTEPTSNLPGPLNEALTKLPNSWMPSSLKAFDRLLCAAVGIPIAWLNQRAARIDAQTASFQLTEAAVGQAVAAGVGSDPDIVNAAGIALLRKSYRANVNQEAIAHTAMADLLRHASNQPTQLPYQGSGAPLEDDWLNVFERYAGDASSERMQELWGRVLSGEIRNPGSFSLRSLRFLSEFSQDDAIEFAAICEYAFENFVPNALVFQNESTDISHLINLEASGLIQGSGGSNLAKGLSFDSDGRDQMSEGDLTITFTGEPGGVVTCPGWIITRLGRELLSILPLRDKRAAATRVAHAMRHPQIQSAYLSSSQDNLVEYLWVQEDAAPATG